MDGTAVLRLDGVTAWRDESVAVAGDGEHAVEWRYVKDDVESAGDDAAWVAGYGWAGAYTATRTTATPVPYAWLRGHDPWLPDEYGAYEDAARSAAANPLYTREDAYVAGLDPNDPSAEFLALIAMEGGAPRVTWTPDLNTNGVERVYTVLGRESLTDGREWAPTNAAHRFFKVIVEMPPSEF